MSKAAAVRKPIEEDPVLRALARGPMGPPDTPEQARVHAEALRGGTVPGHAVTAELAARAGRSALMEAIAHAPISEEDETEEERRFVEEAMRGPFTSGEVVSAEIAARCPRPGA